MKKVLVCAALLSVLFLGNVTCVKDVYEVSCRSKCDSEYEQCKDDHPYVGWLTCDSEHEKCIKRCN